MAEKAVASTKVTKKDLEAQLEVAQSDIEILSSSNTGLMQQTDSYYYALCDEQARRSEDARIIADQSRRIGSLQEALRIAEVGLGASEELVEGLERLVSIREAQQNFVLHVVNSITLYGGNNVEVIKGLAESILAECEIGQPV
jgi:hypothetical protein